MKNTSGLDIVLVMVHVWQDMPELVEIKWAEYARRCAIGANLLPWPKIWQFDYLNTQWYQQHVKQPEIAGWREHLQVSDSGLIPHPNIVMSPSDWITTSNQQTKMVVEYMNPRVVLLGGLHKDLCVRGVLLDIKDDQREYVESDLLSFTWRDTLKKVKDYDSSFNDV